MGALSGSSSHCSIRPVSNASGTEPPSPSRLWRCPALLTFCLVEGQVRQALTARGVTKVDGLYAGQAAIPTGRLILDAPAGICQIPETGRSPPIVPQSTGRQPHLLELLDIDSRGLR